MNHQLSLHAKKDYMLPFSCIFEVKMNKKYEQKQNLSLTPQWDL